MDTHPLTTWVAAWLLRIEGCYKSHAVSWEGGTQLIPGMEIHSQVSVLTGGFSVIVIVPLLSMGRQRKQILYNYKISMPRGLKRNHSVILKSDSSSRLWLILVRVLLPKLLPLMRCGSTEMGPFLWFISGIQKQGRACVITVLWSHAWLQGAHVSIQVPF